MPIPDLPPLSPSERPLVRAGPWTTLVALVGMLAVLLGVQASRFEPARTLTASAHTVPLPEFRAVTPLPAPATGTPPALPPPPQAQVQREASVRPSVAPAGPDARRPSLALLGRRQAEGG